MSNNFYNNSGSISNLNNSTGSPVFLNGSSSSSGSGSGSSGSSSSGSYYQKGNRYISRRSTADTASATTGNPNSATINELAAEIGLDPGEYRQWLKPNFSFYPVNMNGSITNVSWAGLNTSHKIVGGHFQIPNTMLAHWRGDWWIIGKTHVGWQNDIDNLKALGFKVDVEEFKTGSDFKAYLSDKTETKKLHGVTLWSHGEPEKLNSRYGLMTVMHSHVVGHSPGPGVQVSGDLKYKLGFVILNRLVELVVFLESL